MASMAAAASICVPSRPRSAPLRVQGPSCGSGTQQVSLLAFSTVRRTLRARYLVAVAGIFGSKSVSFASHRGSFQSIRLQPAAPRFRVSCAAKPETVEKVCAIVRKQLALSDDTPLNGESKFSQLGADSLDTVEIVMGFEEEFGISVEEESAQNIQTVQDAADMIEKLVAKKSG